MIVKDKDFSFVDDGRAKDYEEAYFMAIRSNYLPLRQGNYFDVEPYSPHRFARQFGFFQEVPRILSQDVRRASFGDVICYWRLCISSKTMEKRLLRQVKSVSRPLEENESSNLDRHWKRPKRDSNISKPMNVDCDVSSHAPSMLNFVKELEDEVLDIEDDETSQDSQESILRPNLLANTFPIGMGPKAKLPRHASVSVFEGEKFVLNHQREFLQNMWSDLLVKKSKTPIAFISSIQDDVCFVLESMKNFQRFDVSKVEELLNALLKQVHEIEAEIAALESTTPFNDEAVENLESSRANLKVLKEELENLSPFT
ncbi:UNVERIFIED_CONTAM: hypothetical protein Sradi_3612600 [Sesamum radiatum]|uniref:Uncharacterized protein n=1 Tax=Sesamum radiatum TaxID=300843 RepID=A0AAW2QI29_SESRA